VQFGIHGPNGTHLCIVNELLGPSIVDIIDYRDTERLPLDASWKVASTGGMGSGVPTSVALFLELRRCDRIE